MGMGIGKLENVQLKEGGWQPESYTRDYRGPQTPCHATHAAAGVANREWRLSAA